MPVDELGQLSQGLDGDHRRLLVADRLASSRIEHPTWHGELETILQSDDETRLHLAPKEADDLDLQTEEGVMAVADPPGEPEIMSSVLRRCAIASRRIS